MIDCPICHVKNADDARFCAECGQRLTASGPPSPTKSGEAAPEAQREQSAPAPRLHSPLLSGDVDDSAAAEQASSVDRLKQISGRQRPERPGAIPETPFKNPFDPRNSQPQPEASPQSGSQRPRLRSPLLGGDEIDEEPALMPPQRQSPGMAGAEEDEQAYSGGGLRSPLLGGSYAGHERRQPKVSNDASFTGHERRRGLHSPILGDAYGPEEDYVPEEEDAPTDEDDPNVLRSPLLAAKRPLTDRPPVNSPPTSNLQTPTRPANSPDAMQAANKPLPSDSYTSLRKLAGMPAATSAEAVAMPPAPQSVPPPAASAAAPAVRNQAAAASSAAAERGEPGVSPVDGYSLGLSEASSVVPPAFQNVQRAAPLSLGKAEPAWTPGQAPAPGTAAGITVQPPERVRQGDCTRTPAQIGALPKAAESTRSAVSRFVGGAGDYVDEAASGMPLATGESSPLPKLLAAILAAVLLVKLWVVISVFSSDWRNYAFLVVDQLIGLALILCLLLLCLSHTKK